MQWPPCVETLPEEAVLLPMRDEGSARTNRGVKRRLP